MVPRVDRRDARVIALTGGIGSGKSTVAGLLAIHGAEVVDADQIAREVVEPGEAAYHAILERFGSEVVGPDGRLDRDALAAVVFADAGARRDLEAITHPPIAAAIESRIATSLDGGATLVVVEVPLLFEAGWSERFDGSLVVDVDPGTQLERVTARDQHGEASARKRISSQISPAERRARATWVIDNSDDLEATARQVERLWAVITGPAEDAGRDGSRPGQSVPRSSG